MEKKMRKSTKLRGPHYTFDEKQNLDTNSEK
jgi:hypothetical protein